jgi:hypothetical protein
MFTAARKLFLISIVLTLLSTAISACSAQSPSVDLQMMSMDQMPAEVRAAPLRVQEAYQFAAANPDIMKNIPCYCGCDDSGHESNYECYVAQVSTYGTITFDQHAILCSICVDITQDVMRMVGDGESPQAIRAYIDATYSKYDPPAAP